jgi:hypothetical protein
MWDRTQDLVVLLLGKHKRRRLDLNQLLPQLLLSFYELFQQAFA